jgi:tRNA (adenine57-N1/adenine58-N1)-methyltransferase
MVEVVRTPLREGETIIIVEPKGKRHFVQLHRGDKFHHTRTGHISHDAVIGQPAGCLIMSETGVPAVCVRLTLEDFILKKLRRKTSIIHPKDLATLLVRGDLFPGAKVMEAGIGSGATSVFLLRHLSAEGRLISYERRPEFIELARENIREAQALFGDPQTPHTIVHENVYDGIRERDLDTIILDVPEPHHTIPHAHKALRPGGILLCWLPTVTQVYMLVLDLQGEPGWGTVQTRETLERSWDVAENAMRPFHRMVGHTGFLIRARKLTLE